MCFLSLVAAMLRKHFSQFFLNPLNWVHEKRLVKSSTQLNLLASSLKLEFNLCLHQFGTYTNEVFLRNFHHQHKPFTIMNCYDFYLFCIKGLAMDNQYQIQTNSRLPKRETPFSWPFNMSKAKMPVITRSTPKPAPVKLLRKIFNLKLRIIHLETTRQRSLDDWMIFPSK